MANNELNKIVCKIFGHNIDYKKAEYSGQIECKICKEYTDIGAVNYEWLNIGYYTKIKIFLRKLKININHKLTSTNFKDVDDLPF